MKNKVLAVRDHQGTHKCRWILRPGLTIEEAVKEAERQNQLAANAQDSPIQPLQTTSIDVVFVTLPEVFASHEVKTYE